MYRAQPVSENLAGLPPEHVGTIVSALRVVREYHRGSDLETVRGMIRGRSVRPLWIEQTYSYNQCAPPTEGDRLSHAEDQEKG